LLGEESINGLPVGSYLVECPATGQPWNHRDMVSDFHETEEEVIFASLNELL